MIFLTIALVLGVLVLAAILGIVYGSTRISELQRRAPIDSDTGLRTGKVLYPFLLTLWARADREGGVVHVDIVQVLDSDPARFGARISALSGPTLHALRLDETMFTLIRWVRPGDEEHRDDIKDALESCELATRRMSSSSFGASEVAAAALRPIDEDRVGEPS